MTDRPKIADLAAAAEQAFGLNPGVIRGPSRTAGVVIARWVVMYIARQHGYTVDRIGASLNRDHGTVCHGLERCQKVPDLVAKARAVEDAYAAGVRCTWRPMSTGPGFKRGGYSRIICTRNPLILALFTATAQQEMSIGRLAHISGVPRATIEPWKRGHMPRVDYLARTLRAVGLELTVTPISKEASHEPGLSCEKLAPVSALRGSVAEVD